MEAVIRFDNVQIYQEKRLILDKVGFKIMPGEMVYLIGKTGSGKTSLLKAIYADLAVEDGEATVVKMDMKNLKRKQIPYLRRKLGIVFQDFQLLDDRTVFDNLAFVLKATQWKDAGKIKERISEVLEEVGLQNKYASMPHQLSGGEQQRIAIARALLNKPEVVLADEPTGNLDPETSNGIIRLLMRIASGGTAVIVATHNYNLIHKFPSRIIKCEEGKVLSLSNETN